LKQFLAPIQKPTVFVVYGAEFCPDGDFLWRLLDKITWWFDGIAIAVATGMADYRDENGVAFHAEAWAMDKWYEVRRVHGKNRERAREELIDMADRVIVVTDGDCTDCDKMVKLAKANRIKTKIIQM
jgi:hypothetical protein